MELEYYSNVRSEITPLLPPTATRILDIGCGVGATAAWLKSRYPEAYTIGVEGNSALLPQLSQNVDEPHIADLNGPLPDVGSTDLVLLLDVLEHLIHPEAVLERVVAVMAEHATVIISLPNIAHLSVSLPLLFLGRFTYTNGGILDRTHLHFFYKESALSLARRAGLEVEKGLMSGPQGPKSSWIDRFTLGLIRGRLTQQYIFSARRSELVPRSMIKWRVART